MRPWNLSYRTKLGDSLLSPQVPFTFFPYTNFWKALATLAFSMGSPPTPLLVLTTALLLRLLSFKSLLIWSAGQLSLLKSFNSPRVLSGPWPCITRQLLWPPNKSPIHTPRNVRTIHPVSEAKHYQGSFDASSATFNNQICSFVFFLFFIPTKTY